MNVVVIDVKYIRNFDKVAQSLSRRLIVGLRHHENTPTKQNKLPKFLKRHHYLNYLRISRDIELIFI